ncbi:hypothetical protein [Sulfobacillus thermosulfidooxidans]|uniref:Uncharacterized protein n=1 Tax=Sulfobacillus thermosulfidooxidans (strain DSM 9293 / VKM B-1269 / AT-1) TaxID=929705 RepID=A0A1W1WF39_SULTA|nr:hypothetical protein [Sulfobacillus thermosulfidooxidans]SMC04918.1 hypothetical protein SAMN00768000_1919 [Sulfobacillus thermosulfidooxidans DSM 9293]
MNPSQSCSSHHHHHHRRHFPIDLVLLLLLVGEFPRSRSSRSCSY